MRLLYSASAPTSGHVRIASTDGEFAATDFASVDGRLSLRSTDDIGLHPLPDRLPSGPSILYLGGGFTIA
jgi:hypothetical protein